MQKAGDLWVPDGDWYFGHYFATQGDCFEEYGLIAGLDYVKNFRCAIDGGAHVGSWTRKLAQKFDHVYAYEPNRDNFACLQKNTEGLDNVYLSGSALGECGGYGRLHPGNNSGCWHVEWSGDPDWEPEFSVRTLDEIGPRYQRPSLPVDYLKLDVEGFEYFALKGGEQTILRDKPVIQIEEKKLPHSYEAPMSARELLKSWGYKEARKVYRDVIFVHGT